jgi:aminopeptidase N
MRHHVNYAPRFLKICAAIAVGVSAIVAGAIRTTAAAEAAPPTGMLPRDVVPLAYRLDLKIDPSQLRFSGHVGIDVRLKAKGRLIWINGQDLAVSQVTAQVGGQTFVGHYAQVDPNGVARIDFDRDLSAGAATLNIDYDAPFTTDSHGLYHLQVDGHWYAWANDEPTGAREVFPSFDEPGFKTPYAVTIRTKAGDKVFANGPDGPVEARGDLSVHRFAETRPLPSYLVVFAVGPFAAAEGAIPTTRERSSPLPLRVVATAPQKQRLAFPLAETPWFIEHLEDYFGMPFPFQKLDLVASPGMQGGMENAGIVMDDDESLLFSEHGSTRVKQRFAILQAHELAHQWFGDLVTPAWWNDSWLNESFADWLGYRIADQWRPEIRVKTRGFEDAFGSMDTDSLTVGRPVHVALTNTLNDAALDGITYGKGSQTIGMIEAYVGREAFQHAVQLHLHRHAYGNATAEDFYRALADATGKPEIVQAMKSFIDQAGVPVVTMDRAGKTLGVRQTRYTQIGSPTPPDTHWLIPLCLRQGTDRTCNLLDSTATEMPAHEGVLMPNAGGLGYYRFEMSPGDWDRLIVTAPDLSTGEALATTDSLWASFQAGRASASQLLVATLAFANNSDADAAADNGSRWGELSDRGYLSEGSKADLSVLIRQAYGEKLSALGFDPRLGAYAAEDPNRSKTRSEAVRLLATLGRSDALRKSLDVAARAYLGGDEHALDVSYLAVAFEVYVELEGASGATRLYDRMIGSENAPLRRAAVTALGTSDEPEIGALMLEKLSDSRLFDIERVQLLTDLLGRSRTRAASLTWLEGKLWKGDERADRTLWRAAAAAPACTVEDAATVERLVKPATRDPRRELTLGRQLERIRDCAALKTSRGEQVAKVLQSFSETHHDN